MPRERDRRRGEKREDLAIIFPVFGSIFLMPIVANLFVIRERVFGIPLETVYLFGVWALLIGGAIGLSFWLPVVGSPSAKENADAGKRTGAE